MEQQNDGLNQNISEKLMIKSNISLAQELISKYSSVINALIMNNQIIRQMIVSLTIDDLRFKSQIESIIGENHRLLDYWKCDEQKLITCLNRVINMDKIKINHDTRYHNYHNDNDETESIKSINTNDNQLVMIETLSEGSREILTREKSRETEDGDDGDDTNNHIGKNSKTLVKRLYSCSWPGCGYETGINGNIGKHMRVHTGVKPYVCEWPNCGKRYQQRPGLLTHQRSHSGEKPFVCDWPGCDYRTNNQCSMPAHKRTHTGVKPYQCDWPNCNVTFFTKTHLKGHKLTHTGEKPFDCDTCGQKFTKLCNLKTHKMSIHNGIKRKKKSKVTKDDNKEID